MQSPVILFTVILSMTQSRHFSVSSAPAATVPEETLYDDERPTSSSAGILPIPPVEVDVKHRYVSQLLKCLKLRDDGHDSAMSSAGCVPTVFSHMDDIPSADIADTILTSIANVTAANENSMVMSFKATQGKVVENLHSLHLRIHKRAVEPGDIEQNLNNTVIGCNNTLSSDVEISLQILSPSPYSQNHEILIHSSLLSYEDLLNDQWMDFELHKNMNESSLDSLKTVWNLEVRIKSSCVSLTLQDIGIVAEEDNEPVLAFFMKENDERQLLENQIMRNHLRKRQTGAAEGGSGIVVDTTEGCQLITHQISFHNYIKDAISGQRFDLNYCAGHCVYPIASGSTRAQVIASMRLNREADPSVLPPPCCVPTRYVAVSFVMWESGMFAIRTLSKASARECGCR